MSQGELFEDSACIVCSLHFCSDPECKRIIRRREKDRQRKGYTVRRYKKHFLDYTNRKEYDAAYYRDVKLVETATVR